MLFCFLYFVLFCLGLLLGMHQFAPLLAYYSTDHSIRMKADLNINIHFFNKRQKVDSCFYLKTLTTEKLGLGLKIELFLNIMYQSYCTLAKDSIT